MSNYIYIRTEDEDESWSVNTEMVPAVGEIIAINEAPDGPGYQAAVLTEWRVIRREWVLNANCSFAADVIVERVP